MTILGKTIDYNNSPILWQETFTGDWEERWDIGRGDWWCKDGHLFGRHREHSGGMIYTKQSFGQDIIMDFYGRTIPPCENDLNFTWCCEGWLEKEQRIGTSYIAGLGGWFEDKVGIENYPSCDTAAATPLFSLKAGQIYHIQAGSIQGHCFIFVDGQLIVEMLDPNPIDTDRYSKIGFGTYASQIEIYDLTVIAPKWEPLRLRYKVEF